MVLTRGREGVQNPENLDLAVVICERPLAGPTGGMMKYYSLVDWLAHVFEFVDHNQTPPPFNHL